MKPKPFEFPEGESFYDVLKRFSRVKYEEITSDKNTQDPLDHISLEGLETEIQILMDHCGYTREEAEKDLRELADVFGYLD